MGDDNRQSHEAPEQVPDLPHHGERDSGRWIDCKQWRRSTRHGFVHADAKRHELEHHSNDAVERLEGDCLRQCGTLIAQQPPKRQEHFNNGNGMEDRVERECRPETLLMCV